ncbi:hypothetical protein TSUD_108680 [Trifolium subterraneum]|nr:hypothetical protein TSUD_108680 [Trifolium subterraneum]
MSLKNLFTKQATQDIPNIVSVVVDRVTTDMKLTLDEKFTKEEVYQAVKDLKALAAPGPDGLPALVYHNYWDIIGEDVTSMALDILNNNGDPSQLNSTHICLIPKIKKPSTPSDFRPIALCNVSLKIITKTLANRIKQILPDVISKNQSAFITGRLITDNTLIAADIFHYLYHTKRKIGYVGIKTDMAKAYDRVEWDFLEATLSSMGFPRPLVQTIMKCVKTVKFAILINGQPSQEFLPQRGLRQGDPLSPYLFILCADVLSGLLSKAQSDHLIHGVKIAPSAPEISHLLFADDSLMFCRATVDEATVIHNTILTYQRASGWKEKNLSFAGRSTLIKVVAQVIPTYLMSSFLIPKGVCDQMEKMICKFWWGSSSDQRKIHWVKWNKGWRLTTHPSSLVAEVHKAKYHPREQFLEAKPKNQMSYSWRSILHARWVIKKGSYWSIGSGESISIWTDNWIHQRGNTTMWSPQPIKPTYVKVKDLMTNSSNDWNAPLINQLFIPQEAQQILNIPITDRSQDDTLTWDNTTDGNYSVKSGYKAIMEWETDQCILMDILLLLTSVITGVTNIGLRRRKMRWKAEIKSYNFLVVARTQFGAQVLTLNFALKLKKIIDFRPTAQIAILGEEILIPAITCADFQENSVTIEFDTKSVDLSRKQPLFIAGKMLVEPLIKPRNMLLSFTICAPILSGSQANYEFCDFYAFVSAGCSTLGNRLDSLQVRSRQVITGVTNIGLRRGKMRWKAEIKSYNFHVEARTQFGAQSKATFSKREYIVTLYVLDALPLWKLVTMLSWIVNGSSKFDWIQYMINQTDKESYEMIVAITYGIWYARNAIIFQNKILSSIDKPTVTRNNGNNISWSPPRRDTLKINVDAHLSSDGRWFTGLVLRRSDGSAVGAVTRAHVASKDVVMGEARALLENNPLADINWVCRKGNRVAHTMAKWAEIEPNQEWILTIPLCIGPLIQKDKAFASAV